MSAIDLGVVIVYILSVMVIGWYVGKDNKSNSDYFMADRSMSWFPIAMSVAATMISANGMIGGPGWAYSSGISPFMINIGVPLAICFVMTTTMPVFYNLKLTSIYEYAEMRFGIRTRLIIVLGFFANSIIQVSSMVLIPALVINAFTGWDLNSVIISVVVVTIIYSSVGGIKAVIWTDVLQMMVMWLSLFMTLFILISHSGVHLGQHLSDLRDMGYLNALNFSIDLTINETFWATLFGGTVMWIRYFGFDQVQVQRMLTAKSLFSIKKSLLFSSVLMNLLYFTFMFIGVLLFQYNGGRPFDNANGVMIDFIMNNFPIGMIGVAVAGVFAAAMSSIDSLFNSMSTVLVTDIYERFFNRGDSESSLKHSKGLTLLWGTIVILFTIFAFSGTTKSVIAVVGSYISNISGPFCGAFILAFFSTRANDKGTFFGVIAGFILTVSLGLLYPIGWIWKPFIGAFLTISIGYALSLMLRSERPVEAIIKYTVRGHRAAMIMENKTEEQGISILPLTVDRYTWLTLGFFLAQYVVLIAIR